MRLAAALNARARQRNEKYLGVAGETRLLGILTPWSHCKPERDAPAGGFAFNPIDTKRNRGEEVMRTDKSKASRQDRLRKVIAGAAKHFPPTTTFTLAAATVTLPQLTQACQNDIDMSDAADQARAAWLTSVQAQRDTNDTTDPMLRAFKAYVLSLYGDAQNAASTLADFGYTPRKPRSKNVAVKALAADKGRATRKARGTMGDKQKKAIKGTVATSPAPGAPTASPPVASPAPGAPTATPRLGR
jgi:hypothetical protein